MTTRHWLTFAFIILLLVIGAILIAAYT